MILKLFFYVAALLLAIFAYRNYTNATIHLKMGDDAPSFTLNDAQGQTHYLSDYMGKYLVLYFYPKDDTPACTKEACHFRDDMAQLEKLGAKVVGVSVDNATSHDEFSKKYNLPFPLLADTRGKVADSYGALTNLYVVKIAKRYTFLISPAGTIAKIYTSVDASNHSQQIIDDLKSIQKKDAHKL